MAKNTPKKIGTHNGVFHSDEVLAVALLQIFGRMEGCEVIRSRNPKALAEANILVDVGGAYDGEKNFDHHQWKVGDEHYGLSSAGLVWKFLGKDFPSISALVSEVDDHDTGIQRQGPNHFCNVISSFNENDISGGEQEAAFLDAVAFAKRFVKNLQRKDELAQAQKDAAAKAKKNEVDGVKIAVLGKDSVFVPATNFVGLADINIQWDNGQQCWTVQTVPEEAGKFGSKFNLEAKGTEDEIFVHNAGFIAKIRDLDGVVTFKVDTGAIIEVKVG